MGIVIGVFLIPLAAIFLVYFASYPGYYAVKKIEILNKTEKKEDNFVSKKIYMLSVFIVLLITLLKLTGKAIEMNFQGKILLVFAVIYIINFVIIFFVFCYFLGVLAFVSTYKNYKSYQKLSIVIVIILILSLFKNIYYSILIVIFIDYIFRENQHKLSRKNKKIIEVITTTVIVGLLLSFVFLLKITSNVNDSYKTDLKEGPLDLDEGVTFNIVNIVKKDDSFFDIEENDKLPENLDFNVKYNNFETKTFKVVKKENKEEIDEITGLSRLRRLNDNEKDFLKNKAEIKAVATRIVEDEIAVSLSDNFNFNNLGSQFDLKYVIYSPMKVREFENDYNKTVKVNQDLINLYFKINSNKDSKEELKEDFLKIFSVEEQKEEIKRLIKTKIDIFQKIEKKDFSISIVVSNDVYEDKTKISPYFNYNVSIKDNGEINVEKSTQ